MFIRVSPLGILLLLLVSGACSPFPDLPPRPANVPPDAIRLGGAKASWWVTCAVKSDANVCQVFNSGGLLLIDDAFLPLDGGSPVSTRDLRINVRESQIGSLCLENGRVLVERRHLVEKRFVEIEKPFLALQAKACAKQAKMPR